MIGPTLFLYYINDMPDNIKSTVRLFADDTIVYSDAINHQSLQDDLNRLEQWEKQWDMEFHPSKCEHICFTRKKQPSDNSYKLHNIEIPRTNCTKYLGVYVDSKLTWQEHIAKITSKANATLAFIRRNVLTTSEEIRSTAYKQLVRPVLEYASCAWDTLTQTVETKLQAVQRRAARFICGIRHSDRRTSTTGLLSKLDLQPLDDRRKCRRLQVFRTYHFNAPHIINEHVPRSTHHSSRRHAQQYFIPSTNTLHYRRFFFVRTAKDWNCLLPGCPLLIAPAPNPG